MAKALDRKVLKDLCRAVLRPVARLALKHAISLQELTELLKQVVVQEAESKIGERVNTSKISIATGLSRREVERLRAGIEPKRTQGGLYSRIIGQWLMDKQYRDGRNRVRALSYEGVESEFSELVAKVSKDLNPYTVLFEFERTGAVERTEKGLVLKIQFFEPKGDLVEGLKLLEMDGTDLISAVEENLFFRGETPNLHLRTEFTKVSVTALPKIRAKLLEVGSKFHQEVRDLLAKYDRDLTPSKEEGESVRVSVTAFSVIGEDE